MKRAVATLIGVIVAVAAAEAYVRAVYTLSVVYEPGIGYVNAPGRARWGIEGMAVSTWGPHGVRVTLDRTAPGAAGSGATVLVLGDSFTEGLMVFDHEVFPAVAQAELDRRAIAVELLNAGRSTMSAADYVVLAPRYGELFRPSWTVAELRSSDLADDAWAAERSHFQRDLDGLLFASAVVPPPRAGRSAAVYQLRQTSMFVGFGFVRLGRFRAAVDAEPALFQASRKVPPAQVGVEPPIEEELDLLFRAWDDRLTLLYLSETDADDPTEERVRRYCARVDASCRFTRAGFLDLKSRGHNPYGFSNTYPGVGHMNAEGHAVAGRLLADELARIHGSITGASR